jgi:hypothetical protein
MLNGGCAAAVAVTVGEDVPAFVVGGPVSSVGVGAVVVGEIDAIATGRLDRTGELGDEAVGLGTGLAHAATRTAAAASETPRGSGDPTANEKGGLPCHEPRPAITVR